MEGVKILAHNCVAHPIAGVLWFFGFERAGDHVHEWWYREKGPG